MTSIDNQAFSTVTAGSNRSFGAVFAGVFALIGLYPLLAGGAVRMWALVLALLFVVAAVIQPSLLQPLNVLWFRFGMVLGRIVNPLVMLLIYGFAVVPTGILLRLAGKDVLALRLDRTATSYWVERQPPGPTPESMDNQF